MPERHHPNGASAFRRRIMCRGSMLAERGRPDTPSDAAIEGTLAHKVVECMLTKEPLPEGATLEMQQHAMAYIEKLPTDWKYHWSEWELDTSGFIEPGLDGEVPVTTVDFSAYNPKTQTLFCSDYKYGHTPVSLGSADDPNVQLMVGSLALIQNLEFMGLDVKQVELEIYQPRIRYRERMTVPAHKILSQEDFYREVDKTSRLEDQARCAGEHCQFCKAKPDCPTYAKQAEDMQADLFATVGEAEGNADDPDSWTVSSDDEEPVEGVELNAALGDPGDLTPDEIEDKLKKIATLMGMLTTWRNSLEKALLERIEAGQPSSFYTVGFSKTSREVTDVPGLLEALKHYRRIKVDEYMPRKLIGITKLEALLAVKKIDLSIDPFCTKPRGKRVLVKSTNPNKTTPVIDEFPVDDDDGEMTDAA